MPLLKGRFMSPIKPLKDIDQKETIYTIHHTKEQFRSKQEYEKRLSLYKEEIWTCQCTGQIKLTHEDAMKSEQAVLDTLKEDFPECHEKPVLEIVHHSTEVLDSLTDLAWRRLHEEFSIGESVTLQLPEGKSIDGTIHKVDRTGVETGETSTCGSPSSNKENSEEEGTKKKSKTPTASPSKSPKKFVFPKPLPYKYSVKLNEQEKIVNGIPAQDITRNDRLPVKDTVKTFIRSYAWRGGFHFNSPWVVKEDIAKKYSLTNKLADIFLSPAKMVELGRKALAEKRKTGEGTSSSKKRKRTQSQDKPPLKKQKSANSPKKQGSISVNKSPKKGTPKKKVKSPLKSSAKAAPDTDSSDDDLTLAEIKNSPDKLLPKSPTKLVDMTLTPRKRGRPTKAESEQRRLLLEQQGKSVTPIKREQKGRKEKNKDKTKMKQTTLFDLKAKKKDGKSTPNKSPHKSPKKNTFKMPPLATRLMKANEKDKRILIRRCATEIPISQIKKLPEEIKEPILKKYNTIQEKKKMEKMSPSELQEYRMKKREEANKKLREIMKKRWDEKRMRAEDTNLDLKPLPSPKLVETPDGLANELFGDVTMVTEFISSYKDLLTPEDDSTITHVTTDMLGRSLVANNTGYSPTARVLMILLQTLLQDELAEDYMELEMYLSELPVNIYTASELVRLCLRKRDPNDDKSESSDESDATDNDFNLPEELLERLETSEFYEFGPEDKLQILIALCHRLMVTYSVQDYMEQKQKAAGELWKQRIASQKEINDQKKGEKQKRKELQAQKVKPSEPVKEEPETKTSGVTLDNFYGKKLEEELPEATSDLASVVKRRRVMAAKLAEQKREHEVQDKIRRQKEAEEYRKQRDRENLEKQFQEGVMSAKCVTRQLPLGTDRAHYRYWLFQSSTPGLFVEKGWAPADILYNVQEKNQSSDSDSSDSGVDDDSGDDDTAEKKQRGRPKRPHCTEKTFPHTGQNLWFMYDNMKDVDDLIKNLHPQGVRENNLKTKLENNHSQLVKSIEIMALSKPKEIEGVDMMEGFREELLDMENRLRAGGLGGVIDPTSWENKLAKASTIPEFGECLIATQCYVLEKFLKGMMVKKVWKPKSKVIKAESESGSDDEDADKKEKSVEDDKICLGLQKWKEMIETCPTFSRLHVLMGMLDACIKWEKSAENAKCKICRKKGDEDRLLLCDDCNQAYHLYCMRPAMLEVPPGEWFCPACKPLSARRGSRNKNYRELAGVESADSEVLYNPDTITKSGSNQPRRARACRDMNYRYLAGEDTESDIESIESEKECALCGGDEGLVACSTCPSSFHLDCHNPPLRREPRSNWRCSQCISGIRIKPRSKRQAAQQRVRKTTYDIDEDYSTNPKRPGRMSRSRAGADETRHSSRGSRRPPQRYQEYDSENESSEEEEEEEEEERSDTEESDVEVKPPPRKMAKTNSGSKLRSGGDEARGGRRSDPVSHSLSPSSQHQTRRRGSSHLVNGDFVEQEVVNSSVKVIMDILKRLCRHKNSWPFLEPVNVIHVPDYLEIVKKPIDLQTIENKCISEVYKSPQEFVDDIHLMFANSYLYNKADSNVGKCTMPMEKHFTSLVSRYLPDCIYSSDPVKCGPLLVNGDVSSGTEGSPSKSQPCTTSLSDHAYYSPTKSASR